MTNKFVTARNTASGAIGVVPRGYLTHPVLGANLVEVEAGAKAYVPELYKPTTADGFEEARPKAPANSSKKATEPAEASASDGIDKEN
jgi:hypothetical protein